MARYDTYATPRLDLGTPFMEYFWDQGMYIADKVLPVIRANVKEGTFSKITRESLLASETLNRGSKSAYARDDYQAEDDTFACEEYGIELPVGDDEQLIYANDFDASAVAAQTAAMRLRIAWEKRVSDLVFNTSTWTGSTLYTDTATTWATIATATPLNDINSAKDKVITLTGVTPDTLIINRTNLGHLLNNTDIKGRISGVQVASLDNILQQLGLMLNIPKILIGGGTYNSGKEGQTGTMSSLWSDSYAMVCKTPDGPSLMEPCIGRNFLFADSGSEVVMESYREEQTRSTVYRARHYIDEKIIDASFGHLLKVD